jgi:hypothetical protein
VHQQGEYKRSHACQEMNRDSRLHGRGARIANLEAQPDCGKQRRRAANCQCEKDSRHGVSGN